MRIVNRATFMRLPAGTIFAKYEPCVFGELCIKGASTDSDDFWLASLTDALDARSSEEFSNLLADAEASHKSVPMCFTVESRDGCFDAKQLFAVFEREDAFGLLQRLMTAFNEGYVGR